MSEKIRLQKFLSAQGYCSRRAGEELIRSGKITIDGKKAMLGDKVSGEEKIIVNGEVIEVKKSIKTVVYAFNKPEGVECTWRKDPEVVTLASFDFHKRVFNIGRLDIGSEGLLLLTNDGDLGNKLMHPRYEKEKEYIVSVNKEFPENFLLKMSQGVEYSPGKFSQPCRVDQVENQPKIFRIILKEGKNRQIRRMCEKLGFRVIELLRIRFGNIYLKNLKPGKFRRLNPLELEALQKPHK